MENLERQHSNTRNYKKHMLALAISLACILATPKNSNAQEKKEIKQEKNDTRKNLPENFMTIDSLKHINYLSKSREICKKLFPEESANFNEIINYIEQDKYEAAIIDELLNKTIGNIAYEKDRELALLLAIYKINPEFDNGRTSKESDKIIFFAKETPIEIDNFINEFISRAEKYSNYIEIGNDIKEKLNNTKNEDKLYAKINYFKSAEKYLENKYPGEVDYFKRITEIINENKYEREKITNIIDKSVKNIENDEEKIQATLQLLDIFIKEDFMDRKLFFERNNINYSKQVEEACYKGMDDFYIRGKEYTNPKYRRGRRKF